MSDSSKLPIIDLNHLPADIVTNEDWDQIAELLRSNQPPTPHETNLMPKVHNAIQKYSKELSILQSLILTIENRKHALVSFTERYNSLKQPIRKLPPELLLHIFKFLPQSEFGRYKQEFQTLDLSQVCKYWRILVQDTQELWSFFEVVERDDLPLHDDTVGFLEMYLEKGGEFPLTLELEINNDSPAFRAITRHAHRWRSVKFNGISEPLTGLTFPILKSVDIYTRCFEGDPDVFSTASNLDTLTLDFTDFQDFRSSGWQLPWKQITNLHLQYLNHDDCTFVLGVCKNVESVCLEYVFGENSDGGEETQPPRRRNQTVVSNVKHLDILASNPIHNLLNKFTFPSLISLKIATDEGAYPNYRYSNEGDMYRGTSNAFPLDAFTALLSRSSSSKRGKRQAPLRDLHLVWPGISEDELMKIFGALEELERLTIEQKEASYLKNGPRRGNNNPNSKREKTVRGLTQNIIHQLNPFTTPPGKKPLLPNVSEIDWNWENYPLPDAHKDESDDSEEADLDVYALVDMIKARFQPYPTLTSSVVSLKKASFTFPAKDGPLDSYQIDAEIVETIRRLRVAGMEVVLSGYGEQDSSRVAPRAEFDGDQDVEEDEDDERDEDEDEDEEAEEESE